MNNSKKDTVLRKMITFDSEEIKLLVTKWLYSEGWSISDLPSFLELVGISTPAHLSNLEKSASFKCIDKFNNEFKISLKFGDEVKGLAEIWVSDQTTTITKKYEVPFNMSGIIPDGPCKPMVCLKSKTILENSKSLTTLYNRFSCTRILRVNEMTLTITMTEPNGGHANRINSAVLKSNQIIDEYLLGLNINFLDLDVVYKKIIEYLGFSDDMVSSCEKILFSYTKKVGINEILLGKILKKRGELIEYAVSNDGETFHVFKNGSWDYLSCTTKIVYDSCEGVYSLSLKTRSEIKLGELTMKKSFSRIKKKIEKMMKLF